MTADQTKFRILHCDDDELQLELVREAVDDCDIESVQTSDECLNKLRHGVFDAVILDLRGTQTPTDGEEVGVELFRHIRTVQFVPIIVYSGFPDKAPQNFPQTMVRTVPKGSSSVKDGELSGVEGLRKAVSELRSSALSSIRRKLIRSIDDVLRSYLWDFVSSNWDDVHSVLPDPILSTILNVRAARMLSEQEGRLTSGRTCYLEPPISTTLLAGMLVRRKLPGDTTAPEFGVIVTPSCDLAQEKPNTNVVVARCSLAADEAEFNEGVNRKMSIKLLRNRREPQQARYHFLPRGMLFPSLLVDFQDVLTVPRSQFERDWDNIASLDSPYSEHLLSRFVAFYLRVGTPDLPESEVDHVRPSKVPTKLVPG